MSGDDEMFGEFVEARRNALLRSAYLLCGSIDEAEDLVQSALVKVVMARRRIARIDSLEAYTRKVLVNVFISSRRRMWRRERPHEVLPDVAESGADTDLGLTVRRAMAAVPARQRAVLVLRFWDDLTVDETARMLGISPGTVKSQTSKGLAALRTTLGGTLPGVGIRLPDADIEEATPCVTTT